MGLGEDGFVERLGERLAEEKGTQVVEGAVQFPAVAQVGADVALEVIAPLILERRADQYATVLDAMER